MSITFWLCNNCGKIHDHKPDYRGNCDICDSYDLVETTLLSILSSIIVRIEMLDNTFKELLATKEKRD